MPVRRIFSELSIKVRRFNIGLCCGLAVLGGCSSGDNAFTAEPSEDEVGTTSSTAEVSNSGESAMPMPPLVDSPDENNVDTSSSAEPPSGDDHNLPASIDPLFEEGGDVVFSENMALITPLSDGRVVVETSNGSTTAQWSGVKEASRAITDIDSVTVSFGNSEPNLTIGVDENIVTSVVKSGEWVMSFELTDERRYLGRFMAPGVAAEVFDLPAPQEEINKQLSGAHRSVERDAYYVETTCRGRQVSTRGTVVESVIYTEEFEEEIYRSIVYQDNMSSGGFYEFVVPSQLSDEVRDEYLKDFQDGCEGFNTAASQISWSLVDLVCATPAAGVVRAAACGVLSLDSIISNVDGLPSMGVRGLMTTRTSEGGFLPNCVLAEFVARQIPFDVDIEVVALAQDPQFGSSEYVQRSYGSLDDLLNTTIQVPYEDESLCDVEPWSLTGRCAGQFQSVYRIEFPVQRNSDEAISASASAFDYDGDIFRAELTANYSASADTISGSIVAADTVGETRVDQFTASLASADTGFFPTTFVSSREGGRCPAEIRLLRGP